MSHKAERKIASMGPVQIHPIAAYSIAVLYIIALTVVSGDDVILQKRVSQSYEQNKKNEFLNFSRPEISKKKNKN
ncbi:hypothetical protein RUM43_007928 [Polyplax serrata]|uniref:Uncharacterized protein n=1 Tax=Polyplax serrata TaxID=468196 RepID=A0AAN8P6D2_POLSC